MSPVSAPRLPNRCPACRGAVIQRMARAHGSIWFHCFFCKHSWRFRLEEPQADADGELEGAVFVTTSRSERHCLGLVVLSAIPEELLKRHLESKMPECERESKRLQREIDALTAVLEEARKEEGRLWKIQDRDKDDLPKARAWSAAYNTMKNVMREVAELRARRGQLMSGEAFFHDMPSAISSAKTDADGTFTLPIPRNGRYGIVARAFREQDQEQLYSWFVWVSLDGAASKRVVLNDANIVGAGSPDSALR